jgi:hypothetical protein
MGFWDIFWPVFAAYIGGSVLLQMTNILIGMVYERKSRRAYEEQMSKMAAQGVDPAMLEEMPMLRKMFDQGAVAGGIPTVSGEKYEGGQYL